MKPAWIAPRRTALVLIDFQADFGSPEGLMAKLGADIGPAQKAIAEAEVLVSAARKAGVTVIFVRLLTRPGKETPFVREAKTRRGYSPPVLCAEDTPGAAFIGPQPLSDEAIISKTRFSAFANTGLAEQLKARGVDTLVLAGLTTECCVAASAWDALERDFHLVIAANACAAYEPALHDNTLRALALSGAILAPLSDIVAHWNKSL